jgi:nucleoside-diphosphate-sugar epimerase
MKLLITGASGFLGAAVARAALAEGHEVTGIGRDPSPPRLADISETLAYHRLDLGEAEALEALCGRVKPDAVIHCAWDGVSGKSRSSLAQLANVDAACRLAKAAADAGATKFIGIGSQAEYGRMDRRIDENELPRPDTLYGAAKLAACHLAGQLAAQGGTDFAWLRLFAIYGPGDNGNWLIPSLIAEMRAGRRPRTSPGTQKWDYLYVDDAARGVLAASATPRATGIFNLASGRPVAVRTIVEHLRDLMAPHLDLVFGEIPFGKAQIMHLEGDPTRLCADTGWSPRVDLEEGLARTVSAVEVG